MTPTFERSPLSPLRAQASRIKGTCSDGSSSRGAGAKAGPSVCDETGTAPPNLGIGTTSRTPFETKATGASRLSSRNENGLTSGETPGRPPPGPVVPGDHDVPAGAISRAKISSARRSA